jgi:hypothetical protein
MITLHYRLILRIASFAEAIVFILRFSLCELFRRRPSPSGARLVSGNAPGEGGDTRPLSESELEQLEIWLRFHESDWSRNLIPPLRPSHMVQLEHSDSSTTLIYLFSRDERPPAIYFSRSDKGGRFDAGWMFRSIEEVNSLRALMGRRA